MLLSHQEIHNGWHNGKEVWISTIAYINYGKRPSRHLKPMKVKIMSATMLPHPARCEAQHDGSLSYFMDEKGKIIGIYARGKYGNVEIPAFTEKNECFEHYRHCCCEAIDGLNDWLSSENKRIKQITKNLLQLNLKFIPNYDEI